jgi:hypothetical protein
MKSIAFVTLSLAALIAVAAVTRPVPAVPPTFGEFLATSPCDDVSKPLLRIPASANCELIKWRLILHQDPSTLAPSAYKLTYTYGSPRQGTLDFAQGETKVEREGRWSVVRVTETGPGKTIYQLDPDKPSESVSFLKLDHNLIHLLDRGGSLLVGNAGWSYTLNRAGDHGRHVQQALQVSIPAVQSDPQAASTPPPAPAAAVVGAFVGRSPCREVAAQMSKTVGADCIKVKWELTLYQDPVRLTPTTYKLRGTFYRERIGEGRWTIVRGTGTDPAAVVYQLDPDKPQGSLFLLRADDNILLFLDRDRNFLVGNSNFSYTLNRAKNLPQN